MLRLPSTDERAAKVLADARAALGGEAKLSAIKSLTTTGRTRRVQGDNLVPIEFEILVELPDKYLRKDEVPAQESDPTTIGFNGSQLVQIPPPTPPEPRPGMPAPPPGQFENMLKARALTARQDFARLMLGLFATSTEAYPLTFKYIGQAEAPQGKAHVLEGTGENNFKIKYFVHMETSLPVMVSWTAPARPATPVRTAAPAPADAHAAHGAPTAPPATPARTPSVRCRTLSAGPRTPSVRCRTLDSGASDSTPGEPFVFCGLPRRRWHQAALPAASRHRYQHDRRNHLRPLSTQSENRST